MAMAPTLSATTQAAQNHLYERNAVLESPDIQTGKQSQEASSSIGGFLEALNHIQSSVDALTKEIKEEKQVPAQRGATDRTPAGNSSAVQQEQQPAVVNSEKAVLESAVVLLGERFQEILHNIQSSVDTFTKKIKEKKQVPAQQGATDRTPAGNSSAVQQEQQPAVVNPENPVPRASSTQHSEWKQAKLAALEFLQILPDASSIYHDQDDMSVDAPYAILRRIAGDLSLGVSVITATAHDQKPGGLLHKTRKTKYEDFEEERKNIENNLQNLRKGWEQKDIKTKISDANLADELRKLKAVYESLDDLCLALSKYWLSKYGVLRFQIKAEKDRDQVVETGARIEKHIGQMFRSQS